MARKAKRKKYPTAGAAVEFHGAYSAKSRAVAKARALDHKYGSGWIKSVSIGGRRRYVAMTKLIPF